MHEYFKSGIFNKDLDVSQKVDFCMLKKKCQNKFFQKKAQTAIEYMLLLAVVVSVVLVGLKPYLRRVEGAGNIYFNRTVRGIMGPPSPNLTWIE